MSMSNAIIMQGTTAAFARAGVVMHARPLVSAPRFGQAESGPATGSVRGIAADPSYQR